MKTVHYKHTNGEFITEGLPALVWPLNHPGPDVSNTRMVLTSVVREHDSATGVFKTMNTVYIPSNAH